MELRDYNAAMLFLKARQLSHAIVPVPSLPNKVVVTKLTAVMAAVFCCLAGAS